MTNPFDPGYYEADELRRLGFAGVGEGARVAKNCTIIGRENIALGEAARIDGFTAIIVGREAMVRIGSFTHIGGGCHIAAAANFTMADFSGISQGAKVYTATDDYLGGGLTNPQVDARFRKVTYGAVALGRHVIVGAGSVILPAVEIGEGSSVGALSLVAKSLAPWGVYAGVPARRIRERSRDLLKLEQEFLALRGAGRP